MLEPYPADEVDIFRTWKLLGAGTFHMVQEKHWRKLPYWVFIPVGISLVGSVALVWYHPVGSPGWAIWSSLTFQLLSHILTAIFWGPLQAKLSKDPLGANSPFVHKIIGTHWLRTALINGYAVILFIWTVMIVH